MITQTSVSPVVASVMTGGGLAVLYGLGVSRLGWPPVVLTWGVPAVVFGAAIVTGILAWWTHQRLQVKKQRIDPLGARWLIATGKGSLLGGAVLAGFYFVVARQACAGFQQGIPGPSERFWESGVASVCAVLLIISGWLLERACVIPPDDDQLRQADPSHS